MPLSRFLGRPDLLERLEAWNQRLADLGAAPYLTLPETVALSDEQLRRVVEATIDRAVHVIELGP